ncbi:MAG: ATP-binding protein, partial [Muribaculaceae bacterium]|nr:ATP-binding protein [Muribaculaceae bacterium]
QEETPNVLLMDEPEISLHISWQDKLITTLRELNPNCQLILTTHSPNIFANGWEDKLVFMEDIESPIKNEY